MDQIEKDPRQEEIIEEFEMFEIWDDKYELMFDYARDMPPFNPAHKTDKYLIRGCQSRVWLDAWMENGLIRFSGESDALITRGIIALIIKVMDKRTPEDAATVNLYFIDRIGLGTKLSMNRANGLPEMIARMKRYAIEMAAQND